MAEWSSVLLTNILIASQLGTPLVIIEGALALASLLLAKVHTGANFPNKLEILPGKCSFPNIYSNITYKTGDSLSHLKINKIWVSHMVTALKNNVGIKYNVL